MELEFFGAAGEVTGSCHVLKVGNRRVLLDCGMIQGSRKQEARNRDPFPFNAASIDAVILSHAHIDHSGRLPLLVKRGFNGRITTHNASRDLCEILLEDSAELGERDTERQNRRLQRKGKPTIQPLYTVEDAKETISKLSGQRYREPAEVVPGVEVTFYDAGHIMGSAIVEVVARENGIERRIVFSGDLGQYDTPILRDPVALTKADVVLMESTYGNRLHRDRSETVREIGEIVSDASHRHGNILIPAFAVGRSQEVMYQFGKHFDEWEMGHWQIFLDSPMAIEASEVYWNYPHLYDDEATRLRSGIDEMPPLPNLKLSRTGQQSREINKLRSGAIIIAGSGMCTGGRILHHLKHNVWRPECSVVIVGYQAKGSLGRRLVEGREYVKIHGESVRVAAKIHTVGGLSAHGDQEDLSRWYSSFDGNPPIFLVHGERETARIFKDMLEENFDTRVSLTEPGMRIDLETMERING